MMMIILSAAALASPDPPPTATTAATPPLIPVDGLVSFWDFQEPSGPFVSKLGAGRFALEAIDWNGANRSWGPGAAGRTADTPPRQPFGPRSASIGPAQLLEVRRTFELAPELNIHGDGATLTVVAWITPDRQHYTANSTGRDFGHVAGAWPEPISARTYVMFCPSSSRGGDWPAGHLDAEISRTGATMQPDCRWSISYALGAAAIVPGAWHMLAMTFDGGHIRAFVNGTLDYRPPRRLNPPGSACNETWQNPAPVSTWSNRSAWGPGGDPGSANVTNFAVGGQRTGLPGRGIGHSWVGQMGGLAVYARALDAAELLEMAERTGMT